MFALNSLVLLVGVFAVAFVLTFRRSTLMNAYQPVLMLSITVGCTVFTSSSFFYGWDEATVSSNAALSAFCNVHYYLLSLGFTLINVGFFLKFFHISRKIDQTSSVKFTHIHSSKFVVVIVFIALINALFLGLWGFYDPLVYRRKALGVDQFGQTTSSFASCDPKEENELGWVFIGILAAFHLTQIAACVWMTYRIGNIPKDFKEYKWVCYATPKEKCAFVFPYMCLLIGQTRLYEPLQIRS